LTLHVLVRGKQQAGNNAVVSEARPSATRRALTAKLEITNHP